MLALKGMLVGSIDPDARLSAPSPCVSVAGLFTEHEALALRVGESDLVHERARRRSPLGRLFDRACNPLADPRLEALRTLVVHVGVAGDPDCLSAACAEARDSGVDEAQIAFVVARHGRRAAKDHA